MLGLSWTEMLVIGVVALIVIGPKDLPVLMGKAGKIIGQIQRMGREFQREINKTTGLDEVRNLRNSITSPLKQTADEIRREFNAMTPDGPKPSGVIKPADPNAESVVNEIREKAGMAPAAKSSTELAAEYGFKPTAEAEAKAAPAVEAAAPAKSEPVKAARVKSTSAKATTAKPADAAAPAEAEKPKRTRAKKAEAPAADAAAEPATKPARKPRAKPAAAAEGETVKKPRAPRKKAADTTAKSE